MSKKEKKTEEEPINKQNEQQAAEKVAEDNATQESAEPKEEDKVQELGEKLAALNDKYLRLYSEYENYRKRTNLEKADLLLNGSRDTIKAILPVIDDFERSGDSRRRRVSAERGRRPGTGARGETPRNLSDTPRFGHVAGRTGRGKRHRGGCD